jgi:hypothetical protein
MLRIMLPNGRVIISEGRKAWFSYFEDDPEDCVAGSPLSGQLALLLGYSLADDLPDWMFDLSDAVS